MNIKEQFESDLEYYKFWCHVWKVLCFVLLFALMTALSSIKSYSQDTTRTPIGYDIDYPHVYIRIDSIHGLAYIYNYYHARMYFSVNGAKASLVARKQVITVWSTHFTLVVSRKRYKRTYKI